ncbi:MAG TPA: DUF4389 domain-containing protein [Solirubrobacteraceae bacterium]|nr:DUF4389 domain-containing protein [Solirubrobacteraceae bacterium]
MSAYPAAAEQSRYPVQYEADYVERRSRLTTFFRWLLAIPHLIVISVLGFFAYIVVIVAWFALLFTARWPQGMYNFTAGVLRYAARLYGYLHLATDTYPPFDLGEHDEYPIRLKIAPPLESYSRAKVFFRILLAIPVAIIAYALYLVANLGAFIAWFVIVITGKQAQGLQNMINLGVAYYVRSAAYFCLITEDWPPFGADD